MNRVETKKMTPKRLGAIAAFMTGALLVADIANAQTLGGFPIREPGAAKSSGSSGNGGTKKKGMAYAKVDSEGYGTHQTINAALKDIAEGGVIEVAHGEYNETLNVTKSVFIRGDRGPGRGVEILAPMNEPCLNFNPKQATAHALVSNIHFASRVNSSAEACVNVAKGVFTLKESDVLGSGTKPSIKISGGMVMLEKNRISAGSKGVLIDQTHSLSQSFIVDNKIHANRIGVDIAKDSQADVIVAGNEIFDNLDAGVEASGYGATKLIGNKVRNNEGSGIVLNKYAKLSLVRYNEIVQNAGDGVAVPFGVNGVIENNDIVGNDGKAIFMREGLEPKVTNNIIQNNEGDQCSKRDRRKGRC